MVEDLTIPWAPITPVDGSRVTSNGTLAALDALRDEWEKRWNAFSESERTEIRQRSLRKLAIETGLLERLYDIDWGLTLTLVAEGFARDVVERHGGQLDDRTRTTLEAQRDSLQMVLDFVGESRPLSASFIKELHAAITRTQDTYEATDALGRSVSTPLSHGHWKTQPNHVRRSDGRLLEYAPPEHVASEIDRLVDLHVQNEANGLHPIIAGAWLHHRFVQIHPFADGNGRVARALVLLVLQKHRYAPLVVDRFHRDKYLTALDLANDGDLTGLIRLFANLESAALTSELEAPVRTEKGSSATVARTLADQLRAVRHAHEAKRTDQLRLRTLAISSHVRTWIESKQAELEEVLRSRGLDDIRVLRPSVEVGRGAERRDWFRNQVITAAHRVGHFADFGPDYSGWVGLRIRRRDLALRYVASVHGAGLGSGVLAVVTFAELEWIERDEEGNQIRQKQLVETTADAFRVVHTESIESMNDRIPDLHELLDEGLAIALIEFFAHLN